MEDEEEIDFDWKSEDMAFLIAQMYETEERKDLKKTYSNMDEFVKDYLPRYYYSGEYERDKERDARTVFPPKRRTLY